MKTRKTCEICACDATRLQIRYCVLSILCCVCRSQISSMMWLSLSTCDCTDCRRFCLFCLTLYGAVQCPWRDNVSLISTLLLTVSAVLSAPSRPEVSAVSATSVLVQWTMSSSSLAHVTSLRLQYKQLVEDRSSAVWKTVDEDIPAGWRSYEVVQLRPGITSLRQYLLLVLNESRFCESSFRVYELFLLFDFPPLSELFSDWMSLPKPNQQG